MQQYIKQFVCLAVVTLCPFFAQADITTDAKSNGATMRIISLPTDGEGKIEAVLDIDLQPGWITYWREPGAAGIPPQIALADPSIGTIEQVRFPVPKKIMLGSYLDIGYDASVQIPFTLALKDGTAQKPFNISVLIGVCKDICIPFSHEFSVDPKSGHSTIQAAQMINAAQSPLPLLPSDSFKIDAFKIADNRSSVDLEMTVPQGSKEIEQVIIAGPPGHAYTQINSAQIEGTKAKLNIDAISLPKDYQEAGKLWTVVVTANGQSMETELKFPPQ